MRKLLLLLAFTFFWRPAAGIQKCKRGATSTNGNKFFEKGKYKEASIMYRQRLAKGSEVSAKRTTGWR